ncbi:MAG: hypothetical protein ABI359_11120 [Ginsengibacter sp.]
MTPEQFHKLDESEEAKVIREEKHIADRKDEEYNILLYQIVDLFVEVYYYGDYNVLRRCNAFSQT